MTDEPAVTPEEEELSKLTDDEIKERLMETEGEIRTKKSEARTLEREIREKKAVLKDNNSRLKVARTLPYLLATIVELLPEQDDSPEAASGIDATTAQKKWQRQQMKEKREKEREKELEGEHQTNKKKQLEEEKKKLKCAVIRTSGEKTIYLPETGLVFANELNPGDIVGVNPDTYLILERLPREYDDRAKSMEVDERPTDTFADIGGLSKQIEELQEAVVWPMLEEKKKLFKNLHITPPKGVLLYGPPGTGKTLLARAVAAATESMFLKLAAPQLVQMYVGDGALIVRDAFQMAKEKGKAVIFIDELDAVGAKRGGDGDNSDREVQRTMLELLNQMDGFSSSDDIKVIAATNRVDILDPALLRSGRFDRKIELPLPTEQARAEILKIHSRKMVVDKDVNFDELAQMTPDFNGAQLKAVCVEAGMIALRRDAKCLVHEDYIDGIAEVQAKKKKDLDYFA